MDEEGGNRCIERLTLGVEGVGGGGGVEGDDVSVMEWLVGLPTSEDLTPLSQRLVSPELASAFSIPLLGFQTTLDVQRAAEKTFSNLTQYWDKSSPSLPAAEKPFSAADKHGDEALFFEPEDRMESPALREIARSSDHGDGSTGAMLTEALQGDSSSFRAENSMEDNSGRMVKRSRLVWTPQLHKRFVEVVSRLGIKNAVPKTIMQLMNVDGLTRENVASHLQKYRLYLKRLQGLSNEDLSYTDHLFASTPAPLSLQEQQLPVSMPFSVPAMIPMPVYSLPHQHAHGLVRVNNHQGGPLYNGFNSHHLDMSNRWSGGSKFAPIISYPHLSPSGT